ncbi:hypothetical protein Tco_0253051 [Tanacetum coccineum]
MADLIFANSHNMVAYLEKSEDNTDFVEKVDFLNASPIMRDLHFNDEDGITCLTNTEIFENLQLMGSKSTAWNEFGINIASAVICLAKKQKFNFSKLIFDAVFNDEYDTPSHTKKVFANMRRQGKDFSGTVTPLFATILIQSQAVEGEGKPKERLLRYLSLVDPLVADKTVHEERGDSVERAATTATSLDAEQGSGNINRTQSTGIPNVPFPQGIGSGGSPRCQEAIGDTIAQTRSERVFIPSYDLPLPGVNTPGSDEERIELKELMNMCTKLSDRVLDLENVKDAQALEIKKLKKRIKKLESKKKSRTSQLKRRLFKVGIESSTKKSLGDQEDSSKQGRNKIDQDERISCINITTVEPVTTASAPVTTASVYVSTAEPSTPPTTITTTTTPIKDKDLTIAQTLMKMKSEKSKAKGVTMQESSESGTRRLQEELDEEARLEREREEEASKVVNIAEWDDVQAMMDADYELAVKLQAEEQGDISIKERLKLFVELMNERKKHFARLRAE